MIEWDHTLDAYLAGCYDYLEQDPYYRVALNPHAGLPDVLADQRISGILEMLASADDPHTDTPITEEELAKELEELAGILGRYSLKEIREGLAETLSNNSLKELSNE